MTEMCVQGNPGAGEYVCTRTLVNVCHDVQFPRLLRRDQPYALRDSEIITL